MCKAIVSFVIPVLALFELAPAQVVVDPGGNGNYLDLQTAINAVPSGTVLKVVGGTFGPLTINKSLTIAGQPAPTIRSPTIGFGTQPAAITLAGNGSHRLVIQNVVIGGKADGQGYCCAGQGIAGSGFVSVQIYASTVGAHSWINLTGTGAGASAIQLPTVSSLVLSGCTVQGSSSEGDPFASTTWAPAGAPGIDAPQATLDVFASTVTGGGCGQSRFSFGPPAATPCPCAFPQGVGGAGIVAGTLYDVGSVIQAGVGSSVVYRNGPTGPYQNWGQQPSGPPVVVNQQRYPIALRMQSQTTPKLGMPWTLDLLFSPTVGVLMIGNGRDVPQSLFGQWVFVDLFGPLISLPTSTKSIQLQVPANPFLGGAVLCFQWIDGSLLLTNPVQVAIGF